MVNIFKDIFLGMQFLVMNKRNQKLIHIFNKQDVTVYLTYIKTLKSTKFRLRIPEAILKPKLSRF